MAGQASWYYKGKEYNVPDTHINFLLKNPEKVGLSEREVKEIIGGDFIPESMAESNPLRDELCIAAMKKGAIRIRCYNRGANTSIQCYDINRNRKDLVECLMDTYYPICVVMDTNGWREYLSDYYGKSSKDFINESKKKLNALNKIYEAENGGESS